MGTTHFELVSPSATLFSGQAEMIVCKAVDGEIAFLADHMPYIGALDPSAVRILGAEGSGVEEVRFAVHGGFVEVKDNQVIMLADVAEAPGQIDVAQAERDEQEASQRSGGPEPDKAAEIELKWAQARLDVARGA
ncbi:MAG: ATP synthase F1 subunit epsilon [Acidimicrobiales bacterium]|nr:ATP synthase F1 subunit epsilon [Acidimicrobiales bacterium]